VGTTADWQYVRQTANYQSNGPVTDVTSDAILCYQRAAGAEGAATLNVTAGQELAYNAKASISHPGPMAFYIAKVPAGATAATFDGKGKVWSKIYQDHPTINSKMNWPTQGECLLSLRLGLACIVLLMAETSVQDSRVCL
jgi:hypothetical protein